MKLTDQLVAVVDTTVPLAGGTARINGEEVTSTSSLVLVPGDCVAVEDLDPKFVASLGGDTAVLRPLSAAEFEAAKAAKDAAEAAPEDGELETENEEPAPYEPPPADADVPGDAGRDLEAEATVAKDKKKKGDPSGGSDSAEEK